MKKSIGCAMAFVLTVMMFSASSALAEIKRGDSGREVAELQQLLFESGWLFELPDGIFGRNTEDAVKGFEEYANLPVDGIADEQMIYELAVSLEALNEEMGIVSNYFGSDVSGYFIGAPDAEYVEENGGMEFAECCVQWTDVDGGSHTDYCEKHHTLHLDTYSLLESNDPQSARYASEKWYEEVSNLYDQWAMLLPKEEQGGILANRATFLASVEAQRIAADFGKQTDFCNIKTEVGVCRMLRNQAAWVCGMIWEQQNGGQISENSDSSEALVLNSSVIIDGQMIYYAGEPEGEGPGVCAMYADGSD